MENSELSRVFCKKCGAALFESGSIVDDSYSSAIPGSITKNETVVEGQAVYDVLCARCLTKIGTTKV